MDRPMRLLVFQASKISSHERLITFIWNSFSFFLIGFQLVSINYHGISIEIKIHETCLYHWKFIRLFWQEVAALYYLQDIQIGWVSYIDIQNCFSTVLFNSKISFFRTSNFKYFSQTVQPLYWKPYLQILLQNPATPI